MNFETDIFTQFDKKWALLSAGDSAAFNSMTVSWGGMGTLWGKPTVTVYVRPSRYTYGFMEKNDVFTVSFYPESCRAALGIMGSKSGRDCDKVSLAGLTPEFIDGGVTFKQAEKTLVCRKIYFSDIDIKNISPEYAGKFYAPGESAHRIYIGEVTDILQ